MVGIFKPKGHEKGYFMGGCLFDHVKPTMKIYKEEIFGPVLCVVRVPNFDAALKLVSDNEYGKRDRYFYNQMVIRAKLCFESKSRKWSVLTCLFLYSSYHAFGGWKRSIFADVHMHGTESVNFYTKLKTITTRWPREFAQVQIYYAETH